MKKLTVLVLAFAFVFAATCGAWASPHHNNGVMRWDDGYRPRQSNETWESLAHRWCDPHYKDCHYNGCRPYYYDTWRPHNYHNDNMKEAILFTLFNIMVQRSGMEAEYHVQDDKFKQLEYEIFIQNQQIQELTKLLQIQIEKSMQQNEE